MRSRTIEWNRCQKGNPGERQSEIGTRIASRFFRSSKIQPSVPDCEEGKKEGVRLSLGLLVRYDLVMVQNPYRSPQAEPDAEIDEEVADLLHRHRRERRRLEFWCLLTGVLAVVSGFGCAYLARFLQADGFADWIVIPVAWASFVLSVGGGLVLACGSLVVSWFWRIRRTQ